MATPDFVTDKEIHFNRGLGQTLTLPSGSFVRPIELCYVPKHVIDNPAWRYFNSNLDMFCYTRWGIFPIQKSVMRRV